MIDASKLPKIDGFRVALWTKVAGRERVYLTLTRKRNGGAAWNGGIGRADYLDLSTGRWCEQTGWAGAATREAYEEDVAEAKTLVEEAIKGAS